MLQVEASQKKIKELCELNVRLQRSTEQMQLERSSLLHRRQQWEQEKDDFERQKRIDDAVQEDLSERLETALEDRVLLRAELEELEAQVAKKKVRSRSRCEIPLR